MYQFLKDVPFRISACFVHTIAFPDFILQPLRKVFRTFLVLYIYIVEVITFDTRLKLYFRQRKGTM